MVVRALDIWKYMPAVSCCSGRCVGSLFEEVSGLLSVGRRHRVLFEYQSERLSRDLYMHAPVGAFSVVEWRRVFRSL